jgi:hypothetical protein
MAQGKLKHCRDILKLNMALYPGNAKAYDSVAETYDKNRPGPDAITNYQCSLQINPANMHAIAWLKEFAPTKKRGIPALIAPAR